MDQDMGLRELFRAGLVRGAELVGQRTAHEFTRSNAQRILLVRPDHLGDVLLTTPAIAALRTALPDATIHALVGPWGVAPLADNPDLDAVTNLPFPGFGRDGTRAGANAYSLLLAAARSLRLARYDLAVNLRPDFWWGAALIALAGIPRRVGFDLPPGRVALSDLVTAQGPREHAVVRSLRAIQVAAQVCGAHLPLPQHITAADAPLVFRVHEADRAWAAAWLRGAGIELPGSPILLHPGSGAPIKAWPARRWAEVLAALASRYKAPVLVTGVSAERAQVEAVLRLLPREVSATAFVDDVPLGRFAALLAHARLVLGVDSGPLHLAAAVGTPTVRLYGPTSVDVFGPWGPAAAHAAIQSDLACAPCGRLDYAAAELAAHPCVRLIASLAVIEAAHSVLRSASAVRAETPETATVDGWASHSQPGIPAESK